MKQSSQEALDRYYNEIMPLRMERAALFSEQFGDAVIDSWLSYLGDVALQLEDIPELEERGFSIQYAGYDVNRRRLLKWLDLVGSSSYMAMRLVSALAEREESPLTYDMVEKFFHIECDTDCFNDTFQSFFSAVRSGVDIDDIEDPVTYKKEWLSPALSNNENSPDGVIFLKSFEEQFSGGIPYDQCVRSELETGRKCAMEMMRRDITVCLMNNLVIPDWVPRSETIE